MVTARFLVGTKADDAILRVHEKIRANYRPHSGRHSRAADRRPRHQRCRDRGADAVAQARKRRRAGPTRISTSSPSKLRAELVKVDNVGLTYISGGNAAADPRRARSGEACRSTASRCSSLSPRCATPTGRSWPAECATTARCATSRPGRRCRHSRYRPAAGHHARRPAGLCARCCQGRHRPEPAGAPRLDGRRRRKAAGAACRRSASPSPSAPAPTPSSSPSSCWRGCDSVCRAG